MSTFTRTALFQNGSRYKNGEYIIFHFVAFEGLSSLEPRIIKTSYLTSPQVVVKGGVEFGSLAPGLDFNVSQRQEDLYQGEKSIWQDGTMTIFLETFSHARPLSCCEADFSKIGKFDPGERRDNFLFIEIAERWTGKYFEEANEALVALGALIMWGLLVLA